MPSVAGITAGKAFVLIEAVDRTSGILRAVGQRLNRFANKVGSLGRTMASVGLAGLVPSALAIKSFADFDDIMRSVEAKSKGTAEEMARLRKQALRLGRTTSSTTAQVAELMMILARRGRTRAEIYQMAPGIRDLARAAGEGKEPLQDIQLAAELVSVVMGAWGKDASEATHIANLLTAAVNNSALTLEGLKDSLSYAGAAAGATKQDFQDMLEMLGLMANVAIEGSKGGTNLRRNLIEPINKLDKLTGGDLGIRVQPLLESGELVDLPQLYIQLASEFNRLNIKGAQRLKILTEIFGLRGVPGAITLTQMAGAFTSLSEALDEAAKGMFTAEKVAKKMDSGIGGSLRRIWSATEGFRIGIGDALSGLVTNMESNFVAVMDSATKWVRVNRWLIMGLGIFFAALTTGGFLLLAFAAGLKLVAFGFTALGTVIGLALSPAVAIIANILILLEHFFGTVSKVKTCFQRLGRTIASSWKTIRLSLAVGDMEQAWRVLTTTLAVIWLEFIDKLITAWEEFVLWYKSTLQELEKLWRDVPIIGPGRKEDSRRPSAEMLNRLADIMEQHRRDAKEYDVWLKHRGALARMAAVLESGGELTEQDIQLLEKIQAQLVERGQGGMRFVDYFGDMRYTLESWETVVSYFQQYAGDILEELGPSMREYEDMKRAHRSPEALRQQALRREEQGPIAQLQLDIDAARKARDKEIQERERLLQQLKKEAEARAIILWTWAQLQKAGKATYEWWQGLPWPQEGPGGKGKLAPLGEGVHGVAPDIIRAIDARTMEGAKFMQDVEFALADKDNEKLDKKRNEHLANIEMALKNRAGNAVEVERV